jgi:4-hydroxy-3-methylbut-2-en-1-yl diphosphate reductase
MPRNFEVPSFYRSPAILAVKNARREADPRKKDLSPSSLNFGDVCFILPRHFGFCFGVENAIEIAYKVLNENPGKRIFLLSEMIHNPQVNSDLISRGIRFLMKTDGTRLVDFKELNAEDIVIVPAFGTTIELQKELSARGIDPYRYDATCPFVEKVWKRAEDLGKQNFTVIVHGKRMHEETRATFSHSKETAPTLVILDMEEAKQVISYIHGDTSKDAFLEKFHLNISSNFDPEKHLTRIGVVNQTTMLATETQEIADAFKQAMIKKYGAENLSLHFADTKDTLCYATNENQSATRSLRDANADLAIVVGGYNSSNTSHLVELCQEKIPTYYIKDESEIIDKQTIRHFILESKAVIETKNWLPENKPTKIAITAGASCPDSVVDSVIKRIVDFFPTACSTKEALEAFGIKDKIL